MSVEGDFPPGQQRSRLEAWEDLVRDISAPDDPSHGDDAAAAAAVDWRSLGLEDPLTLAESLPFDADERRVYGLVCARLTADGEAWVVRDAVPRRLQVI